MFFYIFYVVILDFYTIKNLLISFMSHVLFNGSIHRLRLVIISIETLSLLIKKNVNFIFIPFYKVKKTIH